MIKTFNVTVDVEQPINNKSFSVNTNDLNSLQLNINVVQDNKPIDLTGKTVRIAIVKQDRKTVFQDCKVTGAKEGRCEVILGTQAYIAIGRHIAEVMIYEGSEKVSVTGRFQYVSVKGILDDSTLESTNDFQAINQAIADAEGILKDLRENGTAVDAQAREDLNSVNQQLAQTSTEIETVKSEKMDKNTGDISVSQINKNKGKLDETYMSDTFLQQMAGTTPISTVPEVNSITRDRFAIKAVTPEVTNFAEPAKNLFNKERIHINRSVGTSGELYEVTGYIASDFILVEPNTYYTKTTGHYVAFYTENYTFISRVNSQTVIQTPLDCRYVIVTFPEGNLETYQFEEGQTQTIYEPYTVKSPNLNIDLLNLSFSPAVKVIGKNIFDKTKVFEDKSLLTDGTLLDDANYHTTSYIEVKPNTYYTKTTGHRYALYDKDFIFISSGSGNTFLTTADTVYIRASFTKIDSVSGEENINRFQVEEGQTQTEYEPFKYVISDDDLPGDLMKKQEVEAFVPEVVVENLKDESLYYNLEDAINSWWIYPLATSYKNIRDKTYLGYTTSEGYSGVASIDHNTGQIVKKHLKKAEVDDHNAVAVDVMADGKIITAYTGKRNTDTKLRVRISEKSESVERFDNEILIEMNDITSYAQIYHKNNKWWLFCRTFRDWSVASSEDGLNWANGKKVVLSDEQYYIKLMDCSDDENLLRILMYSNPNGTDTNIRQGFFNASTGDILNADGVTVLGNIDTGGVIKDDFDVILPNAGGRQRLLDIAITPKNETVFAYATFTNYQDVDYKMAYYVDGVLNTVPIVGGGGAIYHPSVYVGGIVFDKNDSDTIYLARRVSGVWVLEKWSTSDRTAFINDEEIARSTGSNILARPFVSDKAILWQEGYYNPANYTDFLTDIKYKELV